MVHRPTAQDFLAEFVRVYERNTNILKTEQVELADVWHGNNSSWNNFMMCKSAKPPAPLERSIWGEIATGLGLISYQGEPLRFDGAFYLQSDEPQWPPYPILVALEHEYSVSQFQLEIIQLLSIRCALKVGMTYLFGKNPVPGLASIEKIVKVRFREFADLFAEDSHTEYLFLAGHIVDKSPFRLKWFKMNFSAAETPTNSHFSEV